jgi:hypothetical protein
MQEPTNTAASPRRRTSRAATMRGRQRREAIVELIASGLERSIGERTCLPDGDIVFVEESAVDGLALSPESRLSVQTGRKPDRNEAKAGEHA